MFKRRNLYDNPLNFIASYYDCGRFMDSSASKIIFVVVIQLLGVASGKEITKLLWRFEDDLHRDALNGDIGCKLNSEYLWVYAAVVEGVGVFLVVVGSHFTSRKWKTVVRSCVATLLFLMFQHVSGLFMNPVVATGLLFGCRGKQGVWEILCVYWLGPIVCIILSKEITTKMR